MDAYHCITNAVLGVDFTAGTIVSTEDLGTVAAHVHTAAVAVLPDGSVLVTGERLDDVTFHPAMKFPADLSGAPALWGDVATAQTLIYQIGYDPATDKVVMSSYYHWLAAGSDGFMHTFNKDTGAAIDNVWPYPTHAWGGFSNVSGGAGGGKYYVDWSLGSSSGAEGIDSFDLTALSKTVFRSTVASDNVTVLTDGRIAAIPGTGATPTVATFYHPDGTVEHTVSIAQPAGESFSGYFAASLDGTLVHFSTTNNTTNELTLWAVDATTGAVVHQLLVPTSLFDPAYAGPALNGQWPSGLYALGVALPTEPPDFDESAYQCQTRPQVWLRPRIHRPAGGG